MTPNTRTWYAVTRPGADTPTMYPSAEYAEAIRKAKEFDYPGIGPWTVIELREVVALDVAA